MICRGYVFIHYGSSFLALVETNCWKINVSAIASPVFLTYFSPSSSRASLIFTVIFLRYEKEKRLRAVYLRCQLWVKIEIMISPSQVSTRAAAGVGFGELKNAFSSFVLCSFPMSATETSFLYVVCKLAPWIINALFDTVCPKNWVLPNWVFADLPQIS